MNDNLVKKPNKDEEEVIEEEVEEIEEDDDDHDDSSHNGGSRNKEAKKKLIIFMGVIMMGALLLLFILWIASLFTTKSYTYEDMETILTDAAVSYFADHPGDLPKDDGDVVEIDAVNLVYAGKMKELSSYRNDGVACTGSVQVEKDGTDYLYTPFLNCGESYYSEELYKKIVEDNPITTSGDGLYSNNNSYVFRGEKVNNYVQLENRLWRVVKITSDGNVVLINVDGLDIYQPWDNRYNEEYSYESGINKYEVSRMKEYLEKIYKNPDVDSKEDFLSKKDRSRLVAFTLCIGSRSPESESKNNSEECRQTLKNQKVGLLTVSDYLYASLDSGCKSVNTKSCMNYNYLAMSDEWWLITPSPADTSSVYKVDRTGVIKTELARNYSKVRPVIYLDDRTFSSGGKGTLEDPYTVK